MNQTTNIALRTDMVTWGTILLLAFVVAPLILFLTVAMFKKFKAKHLLMAGGVLCLIFFALFSVFFSFRVVTHANQGVVQRVQRVPTTALAVKKTESFPDSPEELPPAGPLVASKPDSTPTPAETLPEWVKTGREFTLKNQDNLLEDSKLVFESGLFATEEEAIQDALLQASEKLQQNLQLRYSQYPIATMQLSPEQIRQTALRRSCVQTTKHDFGDVLKSGEPFKQDMHRAYLEVEDSPEVRKVFFTQWKHVIGNQRVVWLGGVFGLITILCVCVSVYLRATHP